MPLNKPTTEDSQKLHSEINQLVNQRFVLTTLAVTIFGAFTAWQIQNAAGAATYATTTWWFAGLLQVLMFLLFLLGHFQTCMLRTITTYLDVTGASR